MNLNKTEKDWRNVWNKTCVSRIPEWDQLSNIIFYFLNKIVPSFEGKKVLEGGSGTGRISLKISQLGGADVILIDTSRKIVKYSRKAARHKGVPAEFIVASIFALPIKSECLDIVWSSGVLEHFDFARQQLAISESMRCLNNLGKNIVIVPNKRAFIYNWLRVLSMKLGKWPLGYEEPLSRNDMNKIYPSPYYVYSTGFFQQFFIGSVPYVSAFLKGFLRILQSIFGNTFLYIDRTLPGYLLIGIFIRS